MGGHFNKCIGGCLELFRETLSVNVHLGSEAAAAARAINSHGVPVFYLGVGAGISEFGATVLNKYAPELELRPVEQLRGTRWQVMCQGDPLLHRWGILGLKSALSLVNPVAVVLGALAEALDDLLGHGAFDSLGQDDLAESFLMQQQACTTEGLDRSEGHALFGRRLAPLVLGFEAHGVAGIWLLGVGSWDLATWPR